MKTTKGTSKNSNGARVGFGAAALVLAGSVLSGINLSLGVSDRVVLILLGIVGMAMCARGMKLDLYRWQNPFNVLGGLMGVGMLLLVGGVITGLQIPLVSSDRAAVLALAGLMLVKVIMAEVRGLVLKPMLHAPAVH